MTHPQKIVSVGSFDIGNDLPLTLIAGPCVLESRDHALDMSEKLCALTQSLGMNFIYKTSFDKANRTSSKGERGLGLDRSLRIFEEIKRQHGCPIVTDVHESGQCAEVAQVADVLQIPAFLCRQTDLLIAAAKTGRPINVKKGQFLAPWDMQNVADKLIDAGNDQIMLCERGVSFGYNTLISDMRSLPILAQTGQPVIFDATHSVQQPGGQGSSSGGQRQFVEVLSRAAVSVGVAGVFIETHENPDSAPSDGPNMVAFKDLRKLLERLQAFDRVAKENPFKL